MPLRPLNPASLTPATIAMFDKMADGTWHDNTELIAAGAAACAKQEREDALKNGYRIRRTALAKGAQIAEAEILASGAKDIARNRLMIAVRSGRLERAGTQHRMIEATLAEWLNLRPHLAAADTTNVVALTTSTAAPQPSPAKPGRTRQERVWGGLTETEGFAQVPLVIHDLVHFRVDSGQINLAEFRAALPEGCTANVDEGEGLYRVDCPHGTRFAVRDHILAWCDQNNVVAKYMRPETDKRRRSARDLDPVFLAELCTHYATYAKGTLSKKHMSTLAFHQFFTDPDDLQQQIAEWILKAVSMYDETQGVPFGAFLNQRLDRWVHDLNRATYGRSATDAELKQQRAISHLTQSLGRPPTEAELVAHLGVSVDTFRKNAQTVATLNSLRNIQTIDDVFEVAIPDMSQADDELLDETSQSMVSQLLTASCTPDPTLRGKAAERPNVLGWVAWYDQMWCKNTKTELSAELGTSMRNINVYADRAMTRMQDRRADLFA